MVKSWKRLSALLLVCVMLFTTLAGCNGKKKPNSGTLTGSAGWRDEKEYTFNDYSVTIPSRWNELNSEDGSERDIYSYLGGAFFEFDFKLDEKGEIIPGAFEVVCSAATKLEDVTAQYKGKYGIPEDDDFGHRAWKFTLRDDLKWDDGTPIKAEDFVYTMSQQISPDYLFVTAANYWSGNYILHNAQGYYYQGQKGWYAADEPYTTFEESLYDKIIFSIGNPTDNAAYGGAECSMRGAIGFPASYDASAVANYLIASYGLNATVDQILALQGKTYKQILANSSLKATWDVIIGWWQTDPDEELDFFVTEYEYPKMDFSEVGMFTTSENSFVIIFDNTLSPLNDDGTMTYEAAYYMSSLPLVKKDLWEKLEDKTTTPWTNLYNSVSVENSASWGPYKLSNFQAGTTYTLSRNENWYGYGMEQYEGTYQTDSIVVRQIPEWNTAWQVFQQGDLIAIGIDVTIADDYRNSSRAYYTPTSGVSTLFIQSNKEALTKEKGDALLKYKDFRKAFSLAIDRSAYAQANTTSGLAYLGIYNDLIYYDVANSGVYRNTTPAKEAILSTYGAVKDGDKWTVNGIKFDDIDDAVDAITGYNPTLAKELLTKAYNEALANGDIDANGKVKLTYGSSEDNENTQRIIKFYDAAVKELAKGTPLEGRMSVELFLFDSATWIDDFRKKGQYDLCNAYVQGGAWNPYYSLQIYVQDSQRLTLGWDTSSTAEEDLITLTVPGNGADQEDITASLSILDWFYSLNGLEDGTYNISTYPTDSKLIVTAALEKAVLESYTTIPIYSMYSASLMSYRCDYVTYEYNTFMGYGGIQYMTYNYDDTEWAEYVQSKGGTLDYKG